MTLVFCNVSVNRCFSQDNGTTVDDNSTPEPEDKNRLKVIKELIQIIKKAKIFVKYIYIFNIY